MRIRNLNSFLFSLVCLLLSYQVSGQNATPPPNSLVIIDLPDHSRMANVKDTNYTRILDGLYISKNYPVTEAFREVAYVGNPEDVKMLGLKTEKPLMLINTKKFPVETAIDSMLEVKKQGPSFPSYVKLPLVLNGKLLTYEERQQILPRLRLTDIREVRYLNAEAAQKSYPETPFGLIELRAPSFK